MKDLKDYYKILGLKEGASSEQVTARWKELKREIQSNPKVGETFKSIREVNEAYEMLKACAPSFVELDMHRFQKEEAASRKAKKEKKRKKKIIISSSILAICLIIGAYIFISERPQVITRLASTTQDDPDRKIRRSMKETAPPPPSEFQAPESIAKVVPQEPSKTDIPEIAKPVTAMSPPATTVPSEEFRMGGIIIDIDLARRKISIQQNKIKREGAVTLNLDKGVSEKTAAFGKGDAVNVWVRGNTVTEIEKISDQAWEEIIK